MLHQFEPGRRSFVFLQELATAPHGAVSRAVARNPILGGRGFRWCVRGLRAGTTRTGGSPLFLFLLTRLFG